jgi:hypothetical protein
MSDNGLQFGPRLQKGALVQLVPALMGVLPNIVVFQYNPERLRRHFSPYQPPTVDEAKKRSTGPASEPFDLTEQISFVIEVDASDALDQGQVLAKTVGIADRLAALKLLTQPPDKFGGDLISTIKSIGKIGVKEVRRSVPICLFVWGPGRILPVRVRGLQIEETLFSPELFPTRATVNIDLQVMTPDQFGAKKGDPAEVIAISAYNLNKLEENLLAVANIRSNLDAARSFVSF